MHIVTWILSSLFSMQTGESWNGNFDRFQKIVLFFFPKRGSIRREKHGPWFSLFVSRILRIPLVCRDRFKIKIVIPYLLNQKKKIYIYIYIYSFQKFSQLFCWAFIMEKSYFLLNDLWQMFLDLNDRLKK